MLLLPSVLSNNTHSTCVYFFRDISRRENNNSNINVNWARCCFSEKTFLFTFGIITFINTFIDQTLLWMPMVVLAIGLIQGKWEICLCWLKKSVLNRLCTLSDKLRYHLVYKTNLFSLVVVAIIRFFFHLKWTKISLLRRPVSVCCTCIRLLGILYLSDTYIQHKNCFKIHFRWTVRIAYKINSDFTVSPGVRQKLIGDIQKLRIWCSLFSFVATLNAYYTIEN